MNTGVDVPDASDRGQSPHRSHRWLSGLFVAGRWNRNHGEATRTLNGGVLVSCQRHSIDRIDEPGMIATDVNHAPARATTLIVFLGLLSTPSQVATIVVSVVVLVGVHNGVRWLFEQLLVDSDDPVTRRFNVTVDSTEHGGISRRFSTTRSSDSE